ncbi:hypothetical protein Hamer_G010850 [Homarus americanus]|uniref:Uncharacterized protein n=1 Tax=Homarus americanus TaxID=6706 RepID=A0A8J5JQE4_HOMAM|nr:hypothetical protein Hamer_G010850 [Homarus americanus]
MGSSSGGEEDGERAGQDSSTLVHREDAAYNFDSRSAELTLRTIENDSRFDEKLQLNAQRHDDKTQLHLTRIDDTLHFKGPLPDENHVGSHTTSQSPPHNPFFGTEINGSSITHNGPRSLDFSPTLLENGADTIRSLESVPWNIEGTETIKENGCKSPLRKWSEETHGLTGENGQETHGLTEEAELKHAKEENKKLKAALKEAAEVNGQWRHYHEHRQKYVQRLLSTIQELHHPRSATQASRQVEGEAGAPEAEVRRLREALTKLQADHDEHVTLLEMQLADSESKRGLCWRCGGLSSGGSGGRPNNPAPPPTTTSTTTPSTTPTPVPHHSAPSSALTPSPPSGSSAATAAPTHDVPQAPLKGWIPVSMLHHIAFSGATPQHQTPVVQRTQQSSRHHQPHQHHQQQQVATSAPSSRSTTLSNRRGEVEQPPTAECAVVRGSGSTAEVKALSPRRTCGPETKNLGTTDDKKKYEAMGARPKVLGNLQAVTGKGVGLLEDEKTAKHRARSILASAIPVSPVSSGPSTPCGTNIIKSPSIPNMPKGYMPITSTVLTPINFRSPFVTHKRPSTIKQVAQAAQVSLQVSSNSSSSSTCGHGRSGSSPTSIGEAHTTTTTTDSGGGHTTPTSNTTLPSDDTNTTTTSSATVSKQTNNKVITTQLNGRIKSPVAVNQDNKLIKDHSRKNDRESNTAAAGNRRSGSASSQVNKRCQSSDETKLVTSVPCSSLTTVTTTTACSNTVTVSCSSVTTVTTTVSCSCPSSVTTSTSTFSGSAVNTETASTTMAGQPSNNSVTCQPSNNTTFQSSSKSNRGPKTTSSNSTVTQTTPSATKVSQPSSSNTVDSHAPDNNINNSVVSQNVSSDGLPSETPSNNTSSSSPSQSSNTFNNTTAFASITVTTTAAGTNVPSAPSTYSSATSSRSSSPGMSLTTFGLNSEGRGIPGAIFFALGSDQRGGRSPQPCTSPRRASNASVGVKSPTPDTVAADSGPTQKDTLPPSGVKSPPIILNSSLAPATVKEEHWWSVESPGRGSTPGRQHCQGKVVNSTWVRLMGGQANSRQGSGLPWRTARAVSGQQLNQARRASQDDYGNGPLSPSSVSSSTATFNYTPAVNSPPSSTLSSATNSAASSPPPSLNQRSSDDLKSMASKNIASAIISYELGAKCETVACPPGQGGSQGTDGVATLTRRDLVCPSCQMLFPPDKHVHFLDHFEACRGPEYADL